jgi:DNA-binding HxlR family transcriptional regulator
LEEGTFLIYTHHMDTEGLIRGAEVLPGAHMDEREKLARDVLGQVAGKWSIGVLCVLARANTPVRFTRVLEGADGITQKVLTTTLRHLERDGLVSRRIFAQVPPRVEYELTPLGRELYRRVDPLVEWARGQATAFAAARQRFDGNAG